MQELESETESIKENKKIIISPFMNWKSKLAKEGNKQIVEQNKEFYIHSFNDGHIYEILSMAILPDHIPHKTLDNQIVMIKYPTSKR